MNLNRRQILRGLAVSPLAAFIGFKPLPVKATEPLPVKATEPLPVKATERQMNLIWRTYGEDFKHYPDLRLIKLGECDTDHLKNILRTQFQISSEYTVAIINILCDRGVKDPQQYVCKNAFSQQQLRPHPEYISSRWGVQGCGDGQQGIDY